MGLLTACTALARLACNVPAALFAERVGRRPLLIAGPAASAVGMCVLASSSSFAQLAAGNARSSNPSPNPHPNPNPDSGPNPKAHSPEPGRIAIPLTAGNACIGAGMASAMAGASLYLSDIATPRNRAQTTAPLLQSALMG